MITISLTMPAIYLNIKIHMKYAFRVIAIFFPIIYFSGICYSQKLSQGKVLEQYFNALYKNGQFNGTVLVADKGKVVYNQSFGYADFPSKKPNTNNSVYPIASITKTITATAILQLHEKGKMDVNDPVIKYLPLFPYPAITITHLLSHTSGLPAYNAFFDSLRLTHPDTMFTNADLLNGFTRVKKPLLYQPGEKGNYDNINFIFLALIVETVSGQKFEDYIKIHILDPAGMTNSKIPIISLYHYTDAEKRNLSNTYRYPFIYSAEVERTDTLQFVSKYWHVYNFKGFGEIISTANDLLKFDRALASGKLLKPETQAAAYVPVLLTDGKINPVGNGLGWKIANDDSLGKLVMHSGGGIGLRSLLLRNVQKDQTVIIVDNTQKEVEVIGMNALKLLNGLQASRFRRSLATVYGRTLLKEGPAKASRQLEQLKKDTAHYYLSEYEMNLMGYQLLENKMVDPAYEVFKIDIGLFPESWNVYDSYGEILLKKGRKEEAIRMYERSMELNPKNENGLKVLKQIREK
jgi:CubicO group peptidase (beta-lactamase class C family)